MGSGEEERELEGLEEREGGPRHSEEMAERGGMMRRTRGRGGGVGVELDDGAGEPGMEFPHHGAARNDDNLAVIRGLFPVPP